MFKKMMPVAALMTFAFAAQVFSMPPHPDLLKKMRETGKMKEFAQRMQARKARGYDMPRKSFPTTGTRKVLVILMNFFDITMDGGSTPAFYGNLFNANGANLTWNKYYKDMSNNQLDLQFTIVGPYPASQNHNYYGTNDGSGNDLHPQTLVEEAVDLAVPHVDFADFDNDGDGYVDGVVIIHAGRGEEVSDVATDIWSHRSTISARAADSVFVTDYAIQPEFVTTAGDSTIGVFVHEFGHVLGLPDLYDTSYKTNGVGMWSVMAGGSWGGTNGNRPTPFLAWERQQLGWATIESAESKSPESNAAAGILGMVLLVSAALASAFSKKKGIRRLASPFLVLPLAAAAVLLYMNCSSGSSDSGKKYSIGDMETSYSALKVSLTNSELGQYLLLENKVKKTGTWTEALPGSGLLITHIDDRFNGLAGQCNAINTLYITDSGEPLYMLHGVTVEEADGDYALWDHKSGDSGSATDVFGAPGRTSFTTSSTPNTNYYDWSYTGTTCNDYVFYSSKTLSSGVKITGISEPADTMSFTVSK